MPSLSAPRRACSPFAESTGPARPAPAGRQVSVYPTGVRLQVAPGADGLAPWPDHIPVPAMIGVFEMSQQPDGSFRPMIRLHTTWVRMKTNICEELGLGVTYTSLRRLMAAGFVKSKQTTPGQYSFCLQSFHQHCAKVQADPEFWSGENLRRYMEAL